VCEELSRRGQEVAGPKAKGTWKVDVGDMVLGGRGMVCLLWRSVVILLQGVALALCL
jgi:hypothetical protein